MEDESKKITEYEKFVQQLREMEHEVHRVFEIMKDLKLKVALQAKSMKFRYMKFDEGAVTMHFTYEDEEAEVMVPRHFLFEHKEDIEKLVEAARARMKRTEMELNLLKSLYA